MRRREFITLLGAAAANAAWPREAGAQQNERAKHVGLLMSYIDGDPQWQPIVAAFRQRLNELGWVDGRNLRLDVRWSNLDTDCVRAQAKELVNLAPDVIVATNSLTLAPLAQATSAIPLVFVNVSDPVGLGFVDSLARPSANITGFTNFEFSTGGKWLELLKDMAPRVTRVGVVFNPLTTSSSRFFLHSLEAAAPSFNVELVAPPSHDDSDVERLIASLGPAGGVIVLPDAFTSGQSEKIISMGNRQKLPAVYPFRFFVARGGLLSYGTDNVEMYRLGASYVDRVLKGDRPSSLPVQAPTKFEMVVNLRTAKDLGLTLSREFLFRADEVIE